MRLADEGGLVTSLLKKVRHKREACGNLAFDVGDGAGSVRIHSGEHGGARRKA